MGFCKKNLHILPSRVGLVCGKMFTKACLRLSKTKDETLDLLEELKKCRVLQEWPQGEKSKMEYSERTCCVGSRGGCDGCCRDPQVSWRGPCSQLEGGDGGGAGGVIHPGPLGNVAALGVQRHLWCHPF